MSETEKPLFSFDMLATQKSTYIGVERKVNWNSPIKLNIVAENGVKAYELATNALGNPNDGWIWVFKTLSITSYMVV